MELTREQLLDSYRQMRTIRAFEERLNDLVMAGKLSGFLHLYAGQEAVAVGVASHLTDSDYFSSTHRGHGHCIAKGVDVKIMMRSSLGGRPACARARADRCTSRTSTGACSAQTASSVVWHPRRSGTGWSRPKKRSWKSRPRSSASLPSTEAA